MTTSVAVNLHNGAIVVHNNTKSGIEVSFEHGWFTGHPIQVARIAPGKAFITDACCFEVNVLYRMRTYRSAGLHMRHMGGSLAPFEFKPHQCDRDGIRYGYAVIVVNDDNTIHEVDHNSCY
ncbi:MAG: hypothetical protein PXZ07_09350 [Candidatus Eremiobacteraeota bacterium]|nr:hypothetical protein [Candidatus Eremiobacteraeota bacterium]